MREQLIQYVELLFAGAPDSEDIKIEILQNTLDRYDDLVTQGKSPEAAYRLAISGIGDVNEILGNSTVSTQSIPARETVYEGEKEYQNKLYRAAAVAMYILCPVPLFILSEFGYDTLGLCMTLLIVAAATVLIILGKNSPNVTQNSQIGVQYKAEHPQSTSKSIWAIAIAVYFIVSFLTKAWHITWIIFLIAKCLICLIRAIRDLKEDVGYEN